MQRADLTDVVLYSLAFVMVGATAILLWVVLPVALLVRVFAGW